MTGTLRRGPRGAAHRLGALVAGRPCCRCARDGATPPALGTHAARSVGDTATYCPPEPPQPPFTQLPCVAKHWPLRTVESPVLDAGQFEHQRVEVDMGAAQPVDAGLPFGAVRRPAIGARAGRDEQLVPLGTPTFAAQNSWRLTPLAPVDAKIEIDTSPTPGGAWDGWRPFALGTNRYWRTRLRVTVRGDGLRFARIPRLVIRRRKFNRKLEGEVVVGPNDPVVVVFPTPFQNVPKVTAHLLGYPGSVEIVAVTATQVTLQPGAAVFAEDPGTFAPTIHWQALGT